MKKNLLLAGIGAIFAVNCASAQDVVVLSEEVAVTELNADCGNKYYTTPGSNWFIEFGGGANMPIVENRGDGNRQFTANYGVGFGKWFSPYFGWRTEFQGGSIHWNNGKELMGHAKTVNGNVDIMWDMFNSLGNVNSKRVFSIVPFVGLGATFNWDYKNNPAAFAMQRENEWLFPVSGGLQLRFRMSSYADFFLQARASFYGDTYNNIVESRPVDIDLTGLAGFSFNIGGSSFKSFNACDYNDYINSLNNQVNDLRGSLAVTSAALAAAEAQLPCPEVSETVVIEEVSAPLLATVRFKIDSDKISNEEKVNVYNMAQWMKNNDGQVVITGYADKDTGTSAYNMSLSERRAKAVKNMLVNEYGIDANRLVLQADGSNVQPYPVNNWNRIVVFSLGE